MEKNYGFTFGSEKVIEKIVDDHGDFNEIQINHVTLLNGDGLPVHQANANVYLIILKGVMTAAFNGMHSKAYSAGEIINVPKNTQMDISNRETQLLDFMIVKAFPKED